VLAHNLAANPATETHRSVLEPIEQVRGIEARLPPAAVLLQPLQARVLGRRAAQTASRADAVVLGLCEYQETALWEAWQGPTGNGIPRALVGEARSPAEDVADAVSFSSGAAIEGGVSHKPERRFRRASRVPSALWPPAFNLHHKSAARGVSQPDAQQPQHSSQTQLRRGRSSREATSTAKNTHRATLPMGDGGPGTGAVCTYFSCARKASNRS
jgi:hypothetical protein